MNVTLWPKTLLDVLTAYGFYVYRLEDGTIEAYDHHVGSVMYFPEARYKRFKRRGMYFAKIWKVNGRSECRRFKTADAVARFVARCRGLGAA